MNKYQQFSNHLKEMPDEKGYFGKYGGAYLPPELVAAFEEIATAYQTICHSAQFINELRRIRKEFQGRPTPVYHCERLSRLNGARISTIPARTNSTTVWARGCWPSFWAKSA